MYTKLKLIDFKNIEIYLNMARVILGIFKLCRQQHESETLKNVNRLETKISSATLALREALDRLHASLMTDKVS